MRHLAKLETKSSRNDFFLLFENKFILRFEKRFHYKTGVWFKYALLLPSASLPPPHSLPTPVASSCSLFCFGCFKTVFGPK